MLCAVISVKRIFQRVNVQCRNIRHTQRAFDQILDVIAMKVDDIEVILVRLKDQAFGVNDL